MYKTIPLLSATASPTPQRPPSPAETPPRPLSISNALGSIPDQTPLDRFLHRERLVIADRQLGEPHEEDGGRPRIRKPGPGSGPPGPPECRRDAEALLHGPGSGAGPSLPRAPTTCAGLGTRTGPGASSSLSLGPMAWYCSRQTAECSGAEKPSRNLDAFMHNWYLFL